MGFDEELYGLLGDLGITKNEVLVYLDLVRHHVCTAQEVSQRAGIYRSNCYESLRRLIDRGLVSEVKKENTSYFQARDPGVLRESMERRKEKVESAISKIREMGKVFESKESASIYHGLSKMKSLFRVFAESGQQTLTYNVPGNVIDFLGEGFMDDYHKKRVESETKLKMIFMSHNERVAKLNKLDFTEVRFLMETGDSNTSIIIWNDYVYLFIFENPLTIIEVKNQSVAETFRIQFGVLWEKAREY